MAAKPKAKAKAKIKPKLSKPKAAPAPTVEEGSDRDAVCATCGVIFDKKDPKPGSKCGACSEKK